MTKIVAMILVTSLFSEYAEAQDIDVNSTPETLFQAVQIIDVLKRGVDAERNLSDLVFGRAIVGEFKKTFLDNYLSKGDSNSSSIRQAYFSFFNDRTNKTAVKMKKEIIRRGFNVSSFIFISQQFYEEASKIIRTSYKAFRNAKGYAQYVSAIQDKLNIESHQQKMLLITGKYLPLSYKNLSSGFISETLS